MLSKRAFYDQLARRLEASGWRRLVAVEVSALFGKRCEDLALTVWFTESRLYHDRLTAEFTLGRHTLTSFPDAPRARDRVGAYLEPAEREALLEPEFTQPGVRDAWWTGRSLETIARVVAAIALAEPRFLAQPGLRAEIAGSPRHVAYTRRLRTIAATAGGAEVGTGPPAAWEAVAEGLLTEAAPKYRASYARLVATDAWNTHVRLGLPLV